MFVFSKTAGEAKPKTKEEFSEALKKLVRGLDDLKSMMGLYDDRDRLKRATSLRRCAVVVWLFSGVMV